MNLPDPIVIGCRRLENRAFLLYPETESVDPFLLKQLLFAWHEASFYGTILEIGADAGRSGIVLPDTMALDFFADNRFSSIAKLEWSEETSLLRKAGPLYRKWLEEGRFAPDYSKWKSGSQGWTPVPEETDLALWGGLQLDAEQLGVSYLDQWLDGIIRALMEEEHSDTGEAWARLAAAYPLLSMSIHGEASASLSVLTPGYPLDEEDWLIAVGWKKDNLPFRTLLQLAEPDETHPDWDLRTVLQDNNDPAVLVVYDGDSLEEAYQFEGGTAGGSIPESWRPHVRTRADKETAKWLLTVPKLEDPDRTGRLKRKLSDEEAWEFLCEDSIRLAETGSFVMLPAWWDAVRRRKPRLQAKVKSSVGSPGSAMFGLDQIVQFDWRLAVGDLNLSEAEFHKLAEQHRRLIQINGQWVMLDPAMLEEVRKVMKKVQKRKGLTFREVLELHLLGGEILEESGDEQTEDAGTASLVKLEVELNGHLSDLVARLQHTKKLPILSPPAGFQGDLRRYQTEGFSWLSFLRQFGLGACLADDMGLGKTVQWIVYLLHLKSTNALNSPALLICPTSVIGNWQMELERFAPDLKIYAHYGSRRGKGEDFPAAVSEADLVITSYTLSHLDEDELASVEWSTLCLDEAQNIKNAYTKQASSIRRLNAGHRVALTGTPVENRLTELWSIFDFINPGYLGSLNEFKRTYVNAVEKGDTRRMDQVQKLVRPFLLRRVKKDPAIQLDLPDKNEMKTYVPLTLEQGTLYESVLQEMFAKLDELTPMERRGLILATLTRLKQVCDHPNLLSKDTPERREGVIGRSSKLSRLLEMVEELRDEGDKCLIFTQFVQMGHLLKETLERERREPVLFLHGGVPKAKRDEMIASFQSTSTEAEDGPSNGIFILSLKAGGTGLNLTAANHVFHFDRWWNPAVENQATDRAFRIGQTRDVQVHKFIALGTLEERIDQMIEKKQGLSHQIIGSGENWITELSTSELRELFALRRNWLEE